MRFFFGWMLLVATTATAQNLPPAGQFGLEALTYRGSGCRSGTVASSITADAQAFTLLFSDYLVDTSPRDGRPARRACDVDVTMKVPAGWSFTIFGLQIRGYASLESGAIGVQKAASSFGARRPQEVGRVRLEGPYDGDYQLYSKLALNAVEWSRCGGRDRTRRFNLKTAITVRPKRGFDDHQGDSDNPGLGRDLPRGMLTVDAIDGALLHRYQIAWRRCDARSGAFTAACSLTVGEAANPRVLSDQQRAETHHRAKVLATNRILQACQTASFNRNSRRLYCNPARVSCSFSQ